MPLVPAMIPFAWRRPSMNRATTMILPPWRLKKLSALVQVGVRGDVHDATIDAGIGTACSYVVGYLRKTFGRTVNEEHVRPRLSEERFLEHDPVRGGGRQLGRVRRACGRGSDKMVMRSVPA